MLINRDFVAPAELTGYARAALADLQVNQFTLSRWLPNVNVDDLEYRFTRGGDGLVEAATFRSYDTESPIGSRPGVTRVTGELPPISRKIRLGEYDRLRQRQLDAAIGNAIFSDAERMTRAVGARMELARGEALYSGKLTIDENGMVATVDFGRAGSHTDTSLATTTLWSAPTTAKVLDNLLTWRDTYIATNGVAPGAIVTSTKVVGYMLRNADIRGLLGSASVPSIVSQSALFALFDAHGLPPIYTYDAQVKVAGSAQRVIPDNRVLLLPAVGDGDTGATLYGTTAEALELSNEIVGGDQPGVVAVAYKTDDPVSVWTKAAAIALPVLANPDLTFAATVAA